MRDEQNSLRAVVMTGLFAAMIYIGIWVLRILRVFRFSWHILRFILSSMRTGAQI